MTHEYQSISDQACAVIGACLTFKPSHRAAELARNGWGTPHQVAKSRGYTRAKGLKRAPAWETHSKLYTCPVMRDYLLGLGLIKVNKAGSLSLVDRAKAKHWLARTLHDTDALARHGWNLKHLIGNDVLGMVATIATPTRYRAEVIADNSGKWCGNALTFETESEAERYAQDLAMRWTMVRDWRVVPVEGVQTRPRHELSFTPTRGHKQ